MAERKMVLDEYFVRAVTNEIHEVWGCIGGDLEPHCNGDNYIAIECILDANRITTFCHDKTEAERAERVLSRAYADHGFGKVVKFLTKYIALV